jgi:DNA-binding MarR family transcriptional regulator
MNDYICRVALKNAYPLLDKTEPWTCTASKLALAIRMVSTIYRKHLKKHKVTMSQLSILMIVGKMKQVPQAELGRMLKLERSTITRDLKRLIENGFLCKKGSRNRPLIEITDRGAVFTIKIIPDWQKATDEANKKLGAKGVDALNFTLSKLMN